MSVYDPALPKARGVAYALIPGHEEIACIADDPDVLTRVIVLHLVAELQPSELLLGAAQIEHQPAA
ncbi:MAG: hypothetical protein ACYCVN_02795 [Acidimicrobiales bacterium]